MHGEVVDNAPQAENTSKRASVSSDTRSYEVVDTTECQENLVGDTGYITPFPDDIICNNSQETVTEIRKVQEKYADSRVSSDVEEIYEVNLDLINKKCILDVSAGLEHGVDLISGENLAEDAGKDDEIAQQSKKNDICEKSFPDENFPPLVGGTFEPDEGRVRKK